MRWLMWGVALAMSASLGCSNGGGSGDLACGEARCQADEVCLYPAYGCLAFPLTDAGVCPDGSAYSDAASACLQTPPTPSCVRLTPGEGSFDCTPGDAGVNCSTVTAPVPSACSRVCRSICA